MTTSPYPHTSPSACPAMRNFPFSVSSACLRLQSKCSDAHVVPLVMSLQAQTAYVWVVATVDKRYCVIRVSPTVNVVVERICAVSASKTRLVILGAKIAWMWNGSRAQGMIRIGVTVVLQRVAFQSELKMERFETATKSQKSE
ncbi:hypothetical protein HDU98_001336 [Podochytrium sp. JEL0797]|nr:hypothetical protein HDU98_001336 [Podochytrium sp. JEL0797]